MKLTDKRLTFKPFQYPFAFEAYKQSEAMHWNVSEIPFQEDVKDWKTRLTVDEKNFLTHIFRLFTQMDVVVSGAYINNYLPVFGGHPELAMMLSSFAAREAVHVEAYSHLIETLGLPETIYNEFLEYAAMREKNDFVENFVGKSNRTIAQQIAVFSAFSEGLALMSSFVMLLNFSRFGKMKGMNSVIAWSMADEELHTSSLCMLFRVFIKENLDIWTDDLKKDIYDICRTTVELEDKFIDLAFGMSNIQGLTKEEMKQYIRFIADRRLILLGMKTEYGIKDNPIPWVESMLGVTQVNFFESKVSDYSKGALTGTWENVWAKAQV
jgi:ribonucleoside-diphosphate reductase beta chain